jgi:hypothetical protein
LERASRRAGIEFVRGAIGGPYSEFGFAVNIVPFHNRSVATKGIKSKDLAQRLGVTSLQFLDRCRVAR